jgi:multiple sugar transport system permease protein
MRKTTQYILMGLVIILAVATIMPLLWMISASFMPAGEASVYPPRYLPSHFTLLHYVTLFTRLTLTRYFLNSAFLSIVVTFISLFLNSMAGYGFAKYRFRGKDKLFGFLVTTMVVPAQVTTLPLFLMLNKMGFINTYMGIIIPGLTSVFGIFLIRQFMLSIPDSLIEAAQLDGAGDFKIYRSLILPLCKPILITLGIFTFMGTWNDFLWPLIVLTDDSMYTLPVALANLSGEHVQDTELMMAGSVVTILPVMILFFALQKYYMNGLMGGSLKE